MRITELRSVPGGMVTAHLTLHSGERLRTTFTVEERDGISLATPSEDVFALDDLDAEGVRPIVRAVVAFAAAATG